MSLTLNKQSWASSGDETITSMTLGKVYGSATAMGSSSGAVSIYAFGKKEPAMSLGQLDESGGNVPLSLSFNSTEDLLGGGGSQGVTKVWSLKEGRVARTLEGGKDPVSQLAFHPTGTLMVTAGKSLTTRVWDLRKKACIQTYSAHDHTTSMAISPDGKWIVSGGNSGLVKIWDLTAGKLLTTFKRHKGAVNDLRFHPSEFIMASGGKDGAVQFWDVQKFEKISTTGAQPAPVEAISFSADGTALLSATGKGINVIGWKPYSLYDTISVQWDNVADVHVKGDEFIAVNFEGSTPTGWRIDLKTGVKPFSAEAAENSNPNEGEAEVEEAAVVEQSPKAASPPPPAAPAPAVAPLEEKKKSPAPAPEKKQKKQKKHKQKRKEKVASVPSKRDEPVGLRAKEFKTKAGETNLSEAKAIKILGAQHADMCAMLTQRLTMIRAIKTMWNQQDMAKAVKLLGETDDLQVVYDVFNSASSKNYKWMTLECVPVLAPNLLLMLQSKFEDHVLMATQVTRALCKSFGAVIKSSNERSDRSSDPVVVRRVRTARECTEHFQSLRKQLKLNLAAGGRVGQLSRDCSALLKKLM